eukprot:c14081_g1_i1 orf=116-1018(+)
MQQRYGALGIRAALSRRVDYEQACRELTLILQKGYGYAPKKLQTVLFEDVLVAVDRLSGLETSQHLTAVTNLVQAAENVLPRQRRTQVLGDFKHAAVMHRRRNKSVESESGGCNFPKDILIDIFGHLDARSLARAAAVCRLWKEAASDELIWKNLFDRSFGDWNCGELTGSEQRVQAYVAAGKACCNQLISWKDLFQDIVKRHPLWFYSSNRAFCITCHRPFWLEGSHKGTPVCSVSRSEHHKLKPLLPIQVLQFLLNDEFNSSSSSSSDSDSEITSFEDRRPKVFKLWSIPKLHHQPMS